MEDRLKDDLASEGRQTKEELSAAEQAGERSRQSQKMEAVGQLAGGLAHDFNNLLNVILGYCELLEERVAPDDSRRRMVEEIHNAGTRAAALTRQLLAFSRRQVLHPSVLDLNRLRAGMETMLRRLVGEHIEIVTSLLPGLGRVRADPTQIEKIRCERQCAASFVAAFARMARSACRRRSSRIHASLYPHGGNWRDAQTVRRGYELNYKLIAMRSQKHEGTLPGEHSFTRVDVDNVVLTAIKKSEDDESLVLRFMSG